MLPHKNTMGRNSELRPTAYHFPPAGHSAVLIE